jgi:hypothetical protein
VRLEALGRLKNPPHPELEPATFPLVAYCLRLKSGEILLLERVNIVDDIKLYQRKWLQHVE